MPQANDPDHPRYAATRLSALTTLEITPEQIRALVEQSVSEEQDLEFKKAVPEKWNDAAKKELRKDVVAMVNGGGGMIVFGVTESDHGCADDIVSISGAEGQRDRMEAILQSNIDPPLADADLRVIDVSGKSTILILVGPPDSPPHCVDIDEKRLFPIRHGRRTRPMSMHELRQAMQGDRLAREVARLGEAFERLSPPVIEVPQASVEQPSVTSTESGDQLVRELIEPFGREHHGRAMLRMACVPCALPEDQPLREKEEELRSLLYSPPRARRSGWYVTAGENAQRVEFGLARRDSLSERELVVGWNGAIVFEAALDTGLAAWAYEQISREGGPVINPMAYIEPLVGLFALTRRVSDLLGYSADMRVDFGFFSARHVRLTPYLPNSYALRFRHDKHNPKIVRGIDRDRLEVFTRPRPVDQLDDRHARELVAELYAEVGFDKDENIVPFFTPDGVFTVE